jgi:hypothetical protein
VVRRAHFGWGIELALALATLGREMSHKIFVGVAQEVVPIGAVLREIEGGVLKYGNKVGEAFHHFLATAEFVRVIKVGDV